MTPGKSDNTRLVFSTETGRVREDATAAPPPDPGDGVVRVSRSKAGRGGKTVTLVTGVPHADAAAVAKELKRLCGSGGAVKDGVIELQGDHRTAVVARLSGRYRVKLAGG
ncbi:MAG: stress response translation initiation inhibitor YciH [Thermoleophilia bacterium]